MNAVLPLPTRDFAASVDALLAVDPADAAVRNLRTSLVAVGGGEDRLPATVNHSEPGNAWVCSPHTAYALYAAEEARRFGHRVFTAPLVALCKGIGGYLARARIDDAVAVNNWLLSTNIYPALGGRPPRRWIDECVARWPAHAVWFRSLNRAHHNDWLTALVDAGCELIPSRQVYLYDHIDRAARRPRDLRRDFALLEQTPLRFSPAQEWTAADFTRAAELYALLYLEKYSRLNPDYSAGFFAAWHRAGLLDLAGFRDASGTLMAVAGIFALGEHMTAPIVGYDTALPQELGLYRLDTAWIFAEAARTGRKLNLSAGAAGFKRARGGRAEIEYSAVFTRHLPASRRRALKLLGALTRGIGEPLMRRFEL